MQRDCISPGRQWRRAASKEHVSARWPKAPGTNASCYTRTSAATSAFSVIPVRWRSTSATPLDVMLGMCIAYLLQRITTAETAADVQRPSQRGFELAARRPASSESV